MSKQKPNTDQRRDLVYVKAFGKDGKTLPFKMNRAQCALLEKFRHDVKASGTPVDAILKRWRSS